MFIQVIPNRGSPPAILLRESYREGGKVKKRTLCNLTHWPPSLLEGFKALLKGGTVISAPAAPEVFTIRRALPHGHVAAVLATLRQIGLDRNLGPDGNRCRDLVIAMVAARLTEPTSKLATAKALSPETAASSLGAIMGLGAVDEDELYRALDWLAERQAAVEAALARRHLHDGTLVLYDVSSSYVEGPAAANSPGWATIATARETSCRLSTGCCARPMAARSPSRCSRVIPPTR